MNKPNEARDVAGYRLHVVATIQIEAVCDGKSTSGWTIQEFAANIPDGSALFIMSGNVSDLTEDILVERLTHERFLPPLESTDQHDMRFRDVEVSAREYPCISGGGRV